MEAQDQQEHCSCLIKHWLLENVPSTKKIFGFLEPRRWVNVKGVIHCLHRESYSPNKNYLALVGDRICKEIVIFKLGHRVGIVKEQIALATGSDMHFKCCPENCFIFETNKSKSAYKLDTVTFIVHLKGSSAFIGPFGT